MGAGYLGEGPESPLNAWAGHHLGVPGCETGRGTPVQIAMAGLRHCDGDDVRQHEVWAGHERRVGDEALTEFQVILASMFIVRPVDANDPMPQAGLLQGDGHADAVAGPGAMKLDQVASSGRNGDEGITVSTRPVTTS